jgi:tRNA(His) 5'-end guanylyltransferase
MKDKQKRVTQSDYVSEGAKFAQYIREGDVRLRTDEYVVVHLDGVKFTGKYYKSFSSQEKKEVVESLANVAQFLCNKYSSARVAYVYGDEISIIMDGADIQANYHNRIKKLCSCISSQTTINFYHELLKLGKEQFNDLMGN